MSFILNQKIPRLFSIFIICVLILVNIPPTTFIAGPDQAPTRTSASSLPKPLADSELPQFITNWTSSTGYTGDNFDFIVNVTDNTAINNVTVNYTWQGAGQWYNLSMTNISWNWTFTGVMPIFNTTIMYYFWANDTFNNVNITGPGYVNVLDNDAPVAFSGSGNFTVGTGNGFVIYANFTDNVGVKNATIYYRKVTDSLYSSAQMNEGNEGEFSVINQFLIETSTDDTDYFYYVLAKDDMDNTGNYTFNVTNSQSWRINVTDDDPPVFDNGTKDLSVFVGNPFTIYANFTDNLGLDNVSAAKIYYKKVTDGSYSYVAMQKDGPGAFSITNITLGIDTTADDTDYQYYLWMNDTMGNNATYPTVVSFNITIIDTIDPIAINGSGDITGLCSSGFTIYANFSDNINVSSAKIFYTFEFNSTYKNVSMTESGTNDGQFFITNNTMDVNIYNNTSNLTYYVIGYDNSDNQAKYNDTGNNDWNITVTDDVDPVPRNGSSDFDAFTDYPFILYANFTDNVNVTRAVIYFKLETNTSYCYTNMTPSGKFGHFIVTYSNLSQASCITTKYSTTPIKYFIQGYDDFDNVGNYSFGVDSDWTITIWDNENPSIINSTKSFISTTGESFIIYANFTDNINISYANIFWKLKTTAGGSTEYTEVPMNKTVDKGHFYIKNYDLGINTYMDDTDILFYFIAFDDSGNFVKEPSTLGYYKITVIDNDKPWATSGNGDISIGTGDDFHVYGNFSDNIGIDHVEFYYKKETWPTWEHQEFSEDEVESVWHFHISSTELNVNIDTSKDDSDFYYFFRVYDTYKQKPNIYNYSSPTNPNGYKITVLDDDPPESAKHKGSGTFKATTGEPFIIYANFTDNVKVDTALIYFQSASELNGWPEPVNMTESTENPGYFYITNQSLKIITANDNSDYVYYVESFDAANNPFIYNNKGEPFGIEVVDNDAPLAIAGANQNIEVGTKVTFNAERSTDNIGIVSYTWTFTHQNIEETLIGSEVDFTFEEDDDFIIFLTIRDAAGNVAVDDLYVNVSKKDFPPSIESVLPDDGETIYVFEVLESSIYVIFSESIDIGDINNIDFFIMNDSSGNPLTGNFSWKEASLKLEFNPGSDLKYSETYTITVTTGVTDKTGKHLVSPKTWSFNTHPRDSDEDGLDDVWEIENFKNRKYWLNEVGASDDPDKDDFTNLQEFEAGTDPDNVNDHPPVDKESDKASLNFFIYIVLAIIIVLVLIILIAGIMIFRKKKAEEEEMNKPTPIEHEILFDDGAGPLGPLPEKAPESTQLSPTGAIGAPDEPENVSLEPALESETGAGTPEMEAPMEEETGDLDIEEDIDDEPESEPEPEDEEDIDSGIDDLGEEDDDLELDDIDVDEDTEADLAMGTEEDLQQYVDSGNEHFEAGNYSDAILEWQKALDIDPDQSELQSKIKEAIGKMKE